MYVYIYVYIHKIKESKKSQNLNPKTCDYQVAKNCPLNGNCKQSAVIYQADVTPDKRTYLYWIY